MKRIILMIIEYFDFLLQQKRWRKRNKFNYLTMGNNFDFSIINAKNGSYGTLNIESTLPINKLSIGAYCSIANNVTFILNSDHPIDFLSTYPFKTFLNNKGDCDAISKGNIIVDDDVWIGYGATILSGVHIGRGAVVAAGAVVSKDVPPYAIVGGVPAKVIKYRFDQPVIDYMLTLDYGALTEDLIREHVDDLYKPIDGLELDEVKTLYSWFPKKNQATL